MITSFLYYSQHALINMKSAGLRTSLAILGILVGTASVVALLSCGQLATQKALEQFNALDTHLIAISTFSSKDDEHLAPNISLQTWKDLQKINHIQRVAPFNTTRQTVSFHGNELEAAIIGADEALAPTLHIQLARGYFVSFVDAHEHFCVVGDTLAQQIKQIQMDDPIGRQLRIGDMLYTIIGIAAPWMENSFFNENINQAVIIPISGMKLISKEAQISNAIISFKNHQSIDRLIKDIEDHMHLLLPNVGLRIQSAKQIMISMNQQGRIFTLLLTTIGSISLLIGGIGVMNMMLVAVSERKKEIGLRKALGAMNRDIQALFLVEALLLSLLGGVLGIVLGLLFTGVIAHFNHWPFTIYIAPILLGIVSSNVTGVFFGFYPARRAAKLTPIAALRGE